MAKERALTLEALRVMDAIDRRGSFAAAADELGRVPSALSYTMQKLEEELDVVLFDRSGHRTKFTNCLLYTSPSPRDMRRSRMPSSA